MGPGRVGGRAGDGDGGALDETAPMLVMLGEGATLATSIVDSAVALAAVLVADGQGDAIAAVVVRGEAPRGGRADGEGRRWPSL